LGLRDKGNRKTGLDTKLVGHFWLNDNLKERV
jgi:hypothetical protein